MMYNFIHVPKAAGQSMISIIANHPDKAIYSGYSGRFGHIRAIWNKYPKSFALVRNPYDRLVSAYYYFVKSKNSPEYLPFAGNIVSKYKTFSEFAMGIERDNLLMDDIPHIKPMYYWVGNSEKIMVDKIFKVEEPKQIDNFLFSIGINIKFSKTVKNTSIHKNYMDYMTPDVINEINRLYRLDFELFNYKML